MKLYLGVREIDKMERNMESIFERTKGNINVRYDMSYDECMRLYKSGFNLLNDAFVFDYAQGMKATKAEMKKEVSK